MRIQSLASSALRAYAALQHALSPATSKSSSSAFARALPTSTRTTISDLARRLSNGEGGPMPTGLSASVWRQDVMGRADGLLAEAGLRAPAMTASGMSRRW
ncbi:MAG: hypothetical protein RL199_1380 [Pseudomonadota bacterium]|jgi:hypothetical protein